MLKAFAYVGVAAAFKIASDASGTAYFYIVGES